MERLESLRRAVVDLSMELPGEAAGWSRFSVQLEGGGDPPVWHVTWFQGPGIEWPPSAAVRGESLTTSAPPGEDAP